MGSIRKTFGLMLVLIFITSLVLLPHAIVNAQTKTLIVPSNYFPTIQSAIDYASAGDTIFVEKGTYYEYGLDINKSLTLIGQDPNETTIDDQNAVIIPYFPPPMFSVEASNVEISGFTLTGGETAIEINAGSGIKIIGNNIVKINYIAASGILVVGNVDNLVVSENNITNNYNAIAASGGKNFVITNNTISDNDEAIDIGGGKNEVINDNTIVNNSFGITFGDTSNLNIYGNNISDCIGENVSIGDNQSIYQNGYGIQFLSDCNNSVIRDNNIESNTIGVDLSNSEKSTDNVVSIFQGFGNIVYQNNFVDNTHNANVSGIATEKAVVSWDNGKTGNYWSDYSGQGSYVIDQNNIDHHPLTQQVNISTSAPTSNFLFIPAIAIIGAAVLVVVVIFLLLYRRHRKKLI